MASGFKYKGPGYRTLTSVYKPRAKYTGGTNFGGMLAPSFPTNHIAQQTPRMPTAPSYPNLVPNTPTQTAAQSTPATTPSTDPRDPTYWTNVGQLQFAYNNAVAKLGTRDVAAKTTLTNQLAELNRTEPLAQRQQRENYNQQGLFYSGHLGQATGDLIAQFANNRLAAQTVYNTEHADYLSQLDYLKNQLGFDTSRELNAATERQISADVTSAESGGLAQLIQALATPTIASQSQQATSGPGAVKAYKTVPWTNSQGVKGVLHIYPGGRRVFVRR